MGHRDFPRSSVAPSIFLLTLSLIYSNTKIMSIDNQTTRHTVPHTVALQRLYGHIQPPQKEGENMTIIVDAQPARTLKGLLKITKGGSSRLIMLDMDLAKSRDNTVTLAYSEHKNAETPIAKIPLAEAPSEEENAVLPESETDWLIGNFLKQPISVLGLQSSIVIRLLAQGIHTVGDLTERTEENLLAKSYNAEVHNMPLPHKHIVEIQEKLAFYNLSLESEKYSIFGFKGLKDTPQIIFSEEISEEEAQQVHGDNYPLLKAHRDARGKEEKIRARNEIATANIGLPLKWSNFYWHHPELLRDDPALEPDDLFIEGAIGMLVSIGKFDYTKGFRFSTYTMQWIKSATRMAILNAGALPANISGKVSKLYALSADYEQQHGEPPSFDYLVEKMEETPEAVQFYLDSGRMFYRHFVSLDAPLESESIDNSDGNESLLDFLTDEGDVHTVLSEYVAPQEQGIEQQRFKDTVNGIMADSPLLPVEKRILELYFGLNEEDEHTYDEIAALLGITRQRVQQRVEEALTRLRTQEVWEKVTDFIPTLHQPANNEKMELWQKGVDCWKLVLAKYQPSWDMADVAREVSSYFGYEMRDMIQIKNDEHEERAPVARDKTRTFAKHLMVVFLYYVGGHSWESIAFWTGHSTTIHQIVVPIRKAFKAVGQAELLHAAEDTGRVSNSGIRLSAYAKSPAGAMGDPNDVITEVAQLHGVSIDEIRSHSRESALVQARIDVIYRLREELKLSFPAIGTLLDRDHTTILHHYQKGRMASYGGEEIEH